MASLGVPIDNDPLYPDVIEVPRGDFSAPLQLLAQRLEFQDPIDGRVMIFASNRLLG
jgi:tRNA pseudouridine32 synthase/23S rRNA pseudouridine746 synthase